MNELKNNLWINNNKFLILVERYPDKCKVNSN